MNQTSAVWAQRANIAVVLGDVGTLFSQPRQSKRLSTGRLSVNIEFLVRGAPVEVFRAVVGFL